MNDTGSFLKHFRNGPFLSDGGFGHVSKTIYYGTADYTGISQA